MDQGKRDEAKEIVRAEVRQILRAARTQAGLTEEQASAKIGCDLETLRRFESGDLTPSDFVRVLATYGVTTFEAMVHLTEIGIKARRQSDEP